MGNIGREEGRERKGRRRLWREGEAGRK